MLFVRLEDKWNRLHKLKPESLASPPNVERYGGESFFEDALTSSVFQGPTLNQNEPAPPAPASPDGAAMVFCPARRHRSGSGSDPGAAIGSPIRAAGLSTGGRGRARTRSRPPPRFPRLPPAQPTHRDFHARDPSSRVTHQHSGQSHHLSQERGHGPTLAFIGQAEQLYGFHPVVSQRADRVEHPVGGQTFAGRMMQVQPAQHFFEELFVPPFQAVARRRGEIGRAHV